MAPIRVPIQKGIPDTRCRRKPIPIISMVLVEYRKAAMDVNKPAVLPYFRVAISCMVVPSGKMVLNLGARNAMTT